MSAAANRCRSSFGKVSLATNQISTPQRKHYAPPGPIQEPQQHNAPRASATSSQPYPPAVKQNSENENQRAKQIRITEKPKIPTAGFPGA